MNYPKLMLVEMKLDGSEHQHLLNDLESNEKFFVKENIMKSCQFKIE